MKFNRQKNSFMTANKNSKKIVKNLTKKNLKCTEQIKY